MVRSELKMFVLASLVIAMTSAANAQPERSVLKAISATVGGSSTFVIDKGDGPDHLECYTSSSALIQLALIPALLTGADPVQIDTEATTRVIKRVHPYSRGTRPPYPFVGNYWVSRIATQRGPDGTNEHLEVFLKHKVTGDQTNYNVYEPSLQQLLIAAFGFSANNPDRPEPGGLAYIDVQFDGSDIAAVTLGVTYCKEGN